ncbi:hypothetical protein [Maribellus sediminis]|uniref:hypothetical protein n=1 Tax=Maribellus sediminis TaxID=2696285 RepID=UPI00142F9157|nr:hypothetical protein [Maribellus sediminis]
MKNQKITSAFIILMSVILLSAGVPAKKQKLHGVWRMVSGKTNGIENPPLSVDRTWEFKADNTFEGKIFLPDGVRTYNQGVFMLPDDTTMVTVHSDILSGKLYPFSYKYNYHINNDTLHFYGFYLSQSKDNPRLLAPTYLDEIWVKVLPE